MKDEHLDRIMKKHIINENSEIDVEQTVMNRIKEYEERKSKRVIYWEYIFSGLTLFSGLLSIFIIQCIFNNNIIDLFSGHFQIYVSAVRWISTFIFTSIILIMIWLILFTSIFKTEKEMLQKHI